MAKKITPAPKEAFKAKLASLGAAWKKATEESKKSRFSEVEDGTYLARLCGAEIKESDGGWRYLNTEFIIVDGETKGETTNNRNGLDVDSLEYIARYMRQLGVDDDTLDTLSSAKSMKEFEEKLLEIFNGLVAQRIGAKIRLKTRSTPKGEFQNLFISKLVELDEDQQAVEAGAAADTPAEEAVAEEAPAEEAAAEEPTVDVGSKVSYEHQGKTVTGEIVVIKSENEVHVRRDDSGSVVKKNPNDLTLVVAEEAAAEEPTEEPVAEEEAPAEEPAADDSAYKKGAKVTFSLKGKKTPGVIESCDMDARTANVVANKIRYKGLSFDVLEVVIA